MGYANYWLGNKEIGYTKNYYYKDTINLFSLADRTISNSDTHTPDQLKEWVSEYNETLSILYFSCSIRTLKDRLNIQGYSLETSKKAFDASIHELIKQAEDESNNISREDLGILRSMNSDTWVSTLHEIFQTSPVGNGLSEYKNKKLAEYMMNRNAFFGYAGCDTKVPLRLATEVISDDDSFLFDLSGLVHETGLNIQSYLLDCGLDDQSVNESIENNKIIILTEGKFDTWVLSESLNLLYPELTQSYRFMDFDSSRFGGGVSSLGVVVKALSAIKTTNKVIAVFDNDTAGRSEIENLKQVILPKNIQIITLPKINFLNSYPTIGPTGIEKININGLAASIDMYLGKEVLTNEEGQYHLIQWTNFMKNIKKYQGSIINKGVVQDKFKEKLNRCKQDPDYVKKSDWSGIIFILKEIFAAFHEVEETTILERAHTRFFQ